MRKTCFDTNLIEINISHIMYLSNTLTKLADILPLGKTKNSNVIENHYNCTSSESNDR